MPPISTTGNLVPLFAHQPSAEAQTTAQLLQLSSRLQTSLDIENILTDFSEGIQSLVPHDGIDYRDDSRDAAFNRGHQGRHHLAYQLTINEDRLGTLSLSRRRKFLAEETRLLENLLCALLYPLRNALLYRAALQAAHKDPLTGVGNRAAFDQALAREIELAQRHHRSLGMIVIDIDHFKAINDTHGHAVGDCLLKAMAATAERSIRLTDQLFRYGGEEFVVLLPETDIQGVHRLAERIRRRVAEMDTCCEDGVIPLTASFGIAGLCAEEDGERFFKRADAALYQAKQNGRNRTCIAKS